jgi:hypothetical protein
MKENEIENSEEVLETQELLNMEKSIDTEDSVVLEEAVTEAAEESESLDTDALAEIENMKRHDAAVMLVTKTRHIVNDAEKQMDACRMLLSDDLKAYEDAKASLKKAALNESESLLEELGYENEQSETVEEEGVVFEAKEERPSFYVQDISSGKFSNFLLSLIVGAGTLAGFGYFAAQKLGVKIDPSKIPSSDTVKELASWYGTLVGGKEDLFIGSGIVAGVTLLIMWIVYGVRVSGKSKKNLTFAKQQLEEAQEYATYKSDCKAEMDKVDAHMNDAIETLKTYEIILEEQNATLKRILHIEGVKEIPSDYHAKSLKEMEDTQKLIDTVKKFMATPMSEEGKLSGKSTMFLHSAKSKLQKVIDKHY